MISVLFHLVLHWFPCNRLPETGVRDRTNTEISSEQLAQEGAMGAFVVARGAAGTNKSLESHFLSKEEVTIISGRCSSGSLAGCFPLLLKPSLCCCRFVLWLGSAVCVEQVPWK